MQTQRFCFSLEDVTCIEFKIHRGTQKKIQTFAHIKTFNARVASLPVFTRLWGGMLANTVDIDSVKLERNLEPPYSFPITADLKKLASKDSKGIMWSFQLARKRKTVPPWSCPVEAWWLMSYPHRISNPRLVRNSHVECVMKIQSYKRPPHSDGTCTHCA